MTRHRMCSSLVLHSRKIFLITLPLLFKKWIGHLNPSHFVDGIRISNGIALTITKLIDFYSQSIFTFLFATVFNWNEPRRQLIAKLTLSHWKIISYLPFVLVYKISIGFNTKSIKCAWCKYQSKAFLNYCRLYIFQKKMLCGMRFHAKKLAHCFAF